MSPPPRGGQAGGRVECCVLDEKGEHAAGAATAGGQAASDRKS